MSNSIIQKTNHLENVLPIRRFAEVFVCVDFLQAEILLLFSVKHKTRNVSLLWWSRHTDSYDQAQIVMTFSSHTHLMTLGRPIGVRLFWGFGIFLRIRIEDTFPIWPSLISVCLHRERRCIRIKKKYTF